MSKHFLWIEAGMGMAGDMFSAALIGLGASEQGVVDAMRTAGGLFGEFAVEWIPGSLPDGSAAGRINVDLLRDNSLAAADAPGVLEQAFRATGIRGGYAGFAQRALAILCRAERAAHAILSSGSKDSSSASLTFIGHARTPYSSRAPYQPLKDKDEAGDGFFIELKPEFSAGLKGLDSFSHLFVISYLERSPGYGMLVYPPWGSGSTNYGLFATRSPNRPNPLGLTRARVRRIEGSRIYTGSLDLFDGTPVVDIKPYIQSLDGPPHDYRAAQEAGNDGWLSGSDHLELHRRQIPHQHPGGGELHEARDIVLDAVGSAWAMQYLDIDLDKVFCLGPVRVGGGIIDSASHGLLPVPAPATQAILDAYEIPYESGPMEAELLTPTGAALLTALCPTFLTGRPAIPDAVRVGAGLGKRVFQSGEPNVLRLYCCGPAESGGAEGKEGN